MKLKNYGFGQVGEWGLKKGLKSGITFELPNFENERAIYAFVVNRKVKYIGVCQNIKTSLKDRMKRYKYWTGDGANERNARKIRNCLKRGKTVKVFALKPESSLRYHGLNVDLIKGLEDDLIHKLSPEWNRQK